MKRFRQPQLYWILIAGFVLASCGRVPQRAGMNGEFGGGTASPGSGTGQPSGKGQPVPGKFEPEGGQEPGPVRQDPETPDRQRSPETSSPGSEQEPRPEPARPPSGAQSPAGLAGVYAALPKAESSKAYLKYFEPSGRPLFGGGTAFQDRLRRNFGPRLNQPQPATDNGRRIYQELVAAVNREVPTERAYLLISEGDARYWSRQIELNGGRSPKRGAYSIAVMQTAVRHGFANVPCAEFVSEVIREAYARANVDVLGDFNSHRKNVLLWSTTAAVVELRRALLKAGWVPWTTREYRPPVGAILLNGVGETPGHAFLSGGQDGRFIVDNGAPQGRDLGNGTNAATIAMMFSAGVFFLPPGIDPAKWH